MGDVRAVAVLAALVMAVLMTTVSGNGSARAAEGETWAFLFADQENATAAYSPEDMKASRGDIEGTVTRTGTGAYTVLLANAAAPGVPIVTAANDQGVHCQLASYTAGSADDSKFTLSFLSSTQPGSGAAGAYGYILDDQPTLATYTNPATRFNSTNGDVVITRGSDPRYWTVRFTGQSFNNTGGNVQVSALGTRPARCGVVNWTPNSAGVDAQVRCDNLSGVTSFTPQWTLVYAHGRSLVGGSGGYFGYLQADQPSATDYTPSLPRNLAPFGFAHTITRQAVGTYVAHVHGPVNQSVVVHASVNRDTDKYCTLVSWTVTSNQQQAADIRVNCYTSGGAPADAWFSLNYYSP